MLKGRQTVTAVPFASNKDEAEQTCRAAEVLEGFKHMRHLQSDPNTIR